MTLAAADFNFCIDPQLSLRSLRASDAATLLHLVEQNRAQLGRFLYWVAAVQDLASARHYIGQRIRSPLPHARWFTVRVEGEIGGIFAIKSIDRKSGTAELGYWLAAPVQGRGVLNRIINALPRLLHSCGTAALVQRIEFRCLHNNTASIRVAQRAGAHLVDRLPAHATIANTVQDLLIYQAPLSPFESRPE